MKLTVRYLGLDVHADTIVIAVAEEGRAPAKVLATIPHCWKTLHARLKVLAAQGQLLICYEAGPTGYVLYRKLRSAGFDAQVIAPSLIPRKSGVGVKTDRRDAAALAHFLRSGDLTRVWVPDEQGEALRDLSRAREAAKSAELAARQQLGKFLLRHGRRWELSTWTKKHLDWIRTQKFEQAAQNRVLADALRAVEDATARIERLETDLQRFGSARQLMAYLGLVPSEHSSGLTQRRGSITKSGNSHARRILVEAAHHAPRPTTTSKILRQRQLGLAPEVIRIANKAQQRLQRRFLALYQKGKSKPKVVVAIARELAGFLWAIAQQPQLLAT